MLKIRYSIPVLLFFLSACGSSGDTVVSPSGGVSIADALPSGSLSFIHLNDTYRIDAVEEGTRGGFARVATLVRQLQRQGNEVRILHAGDFLYPSLESQLWNGEQMVEALNFLDGLAPLYVVPGNHEFDPRTPDELQERVRESTFDWLGDNIRFATGEEDVDERLHSGFTFATRGRTIGIFALTLHPDDGGNLRDHVPIEPDYLAQAERVIAEFEEQGVDLIIGLTHLYLDDDKEIAALKERHPRFAFIAGGHDHEPEFIAGDEENAIVMKGASNARTIWRTDVQFVDDVPQIATTRMAVDSAVPPDREYQLLAGKWRDRLLELMPFLASQIGRAGVRLDGREVTVRNAESNLGNFIADQMRLAFRSPLADFAFVNGGTLRIDDYIADDITFEDIGRTFGFSSFLRFLTMDGSDFRQLMEAAYRGSGPGKGYFPQVSGFRVCVDRSRAEGQRIVQLLARADGDWQEIQPDRAYTVVVPDFLYRGGDGYDFSAARDVSRPGSELKYLVLDAILRAQSVGQPVGEAIDPGSARIAFLAEDAAACF